MLSSHVQKVSPLRRWLCTPVVLLATGAGAGPYIDAASFTSPLFEPIRDLAPLRVWGAAWVVAAIAALIAAVRGSWAAYTVSNVMLAGLSALWLATLIYARWWLEIALSTTAIGLWAFPLTYALVVSFVDAEVVEVPRGRIARTP